MIRAYYRYAAILVAMIPALFRNQREQAIVELALRRQLAVYGHKHSRPRLSAMDRSFWLALFRFWPRWKSCLVIVQPETVVRWHREGFRRYWRSISKKGPGRPSISPELRGLIQRLASENPWRARRIQAELEKLGITVGLATMSRYLPRRGVSDDQRQRWTTFLRNHRDVTSAMDFLVVPTIRFKILFVWFVVTHGRREVLHFNVTEHPTAPWVIQQLREAFPNETSTMFLIHDNDAIFSANFLETIESLGIAPEPTSSGSPWQNGIAERWVGSLRRELLDHVVVLDEVHLRRLLREYATYYNEDRVHTCLRDAPRPRTVENRASPAAKIIGSPRVGGLHHRYTWSEAA